MTSVYSLKNALLENNYTIWLLAVILSLTAHALLFYQRNSSLNAVPAMVIQETITHVRFANIAPPPPTVIEPQVITPKTEPVVLPELIPEKVVEKIIKKPEPVVVKQKPKARPHKKKKPKPKVIKPVRKKTLSKKPPVKEKSRQLRPQVSSNPAKSAPVKHIKASPIVARADQRLIEQTRMTYQALLMRHIEAHKNYPRVARKRKIEGKIIVSFTLLADGQIKNLRLNGKRSILQKASRNAIQAALPMPRPPSEISLPAEIKFVMNYFLK